jgi:hypothetical protein
MQQQSAFHLAFNADAETKLISGVLLIQMHLKQ